MGSAAYRTYRQESNEARDSRSGVIEQKPLGRKNKRPRPIIVEVRFLYRGWQKWGSYRDLPTADAALANASRKYGAEFRIRPIEEGE